MKEQRFEKVVEWERSKYDHGNLIFNSLLISLAAILYLFVPASEIILIVAIILNLFYLLIKLSDRKVYWREI